MPLERGMTLDAENLSKEFYDSSEGKSIEKPWVVYGWFMGSNGIGKVVREGKTWANILYVEGQQYPPECWDDNWIQRFDNPVKALAYVFGQFSK